jgi:hypothetical protein
MEPSAHETGDLPRRLPQAKEEVRRLCGGFLALALRCALFLIAFLSNEGVAVRESDSK